MSTWPSASSAVVALLMSVASVRSVHWAHERRVCRSFVQLAFFLLLRNAGFRPMQEPEAVADRTWTCALTQVLRNASSGLLDAYG